MVEDEGKQDEKIDISTEDNMPGNISQARVLGLVASARPG